MLIRGPWTDHSLPDADRLSPADERRIADYARHAAFIDGDQWEQSRRRSDPTRLTANYARTLIRKTASYVFSGPIGVNVLGADDPAPIEQRLTMLRRSLGLDALDASLAAQSMALGDAAMKITWDHDSASPRVTPVDPAMLVATTRADDPRQATSIQQTYALRGRDIRDLVGPAGEVALEPDVRYPVIERWTPDRWSMTVAGQVVIDRDNPYGWIPYLVIPNEPAPDAFWGTSDLNDLVDLCREVNTRVTTLSHILTLSGAPIAVLENVDSSEGIRVGPGAKWELPEGSRAYLLDLLQGGGIDLHVRHIEMLFRMLHDVSETPRTAFGDGGRDLSGAALEVEIQPLLQKVNRKRRVWDAVMHRRNAMLLDLFARFGGEEIGDTTDTETIWPPILPRDRTGAVQNAVSLVAAGIQSRASAMASLGESDPEAELERMRHEASALPTP